MPRRRRCDERAQAKCSLFSFFSVLKLKANNIFSSFFAPPFCAKMLNGWFFFWMFGELMKVRDCFLSNSQGLWCSKVRKEEKLLSRTAQFTGFFQISKRKFFHSWIVLHLSPVGSNNFEHVLASSKDLQICSMGFFSEPDVRKGFGRDCAHLGSRCGMWDELWVFACMRFF